ncbi:MAG TPA: polysaccharide deacetylase family protein [Solirubrobacteraceae bacterium]|jgi:peptidoglycan/xylan/chitin deacetylase (PgdA/CDA1 family)|nr:polysaccharide deacetylase family protein [Solirubrobacteraceae bacterium]
MSPRWNWDFEDDQRGRRKDSAPPPPSATVERPARPAGADGPDPRARYRRRRLGVIAGFIVLLIVLIVALSGSHGHGAVSSAGTHTPHAVAPSPPPIDELKRGDKAVDSVLAYTPFVKEGGAQTREVALTFDDGPGPYTPQVLDVLEREHAPATFFVIGQEIHDFGASTEREIRDGFTIGDHTENHPMLAHLSEHDQHEQLFEQAARIELLGGRKPRLFRPPYGSFNATTFRLLHQMRMLMVLWSVDTDDYEQPGVETIVQRVIEGAKPGAIFLMHDAGGNREQTVAALPRIIHELRARGFRLVSVPRLLADDPPPHGQPLPTSLAGD